MMRWWQYGFWLTCLCLVPGCDDTSSGGGEEYREELAGDVDEDVGPDGDACSGEARCAWWKGTVQIEGKEWVLDEIEPVVKVEHCHELELNQVRAVLSIPAVLSAGASDRPVLRITGRRKQVKLGETHHLPSTEKKIPGRALAYLSPEGRGTSARLAEAGSLRYEALEEGGPLDLFFSLDYGDLGSVEGRVKVPDTESDTCILPSGADGPVPKTRPIRSKKVPSEDVP